MSMKTMTDAIKKGIKGGLNAPKNLFKGDFDALKDDLGDIVEGGYKSGPTYKALGEVNDYLKPELPEFPDPIIPDPAATPDSGDPLDKLRGRKRRKGRADTIQAGSLIPTDVGKKSLLG